MDPGDNRVSQLQVYDMSQASGTSRNLSAGLACRLCDCLLTGCLVLVHRNLFLQTGIPPDGTYDAY